MERYFEPVAVIFGIVQTAFYIDFAWVYWTRQRVKLRNGGVVDSEDLSRGWLVSRLMGRGRDSLDEEDGLAESAATNGSTKPPRGGWGARGVSVSADDEVLDLHHESNQAYPGDAKAREGEISDDEEGAGPYKDRGADEANGPSDGHEWRDGSK